MPTPSSNAVRLTLPMIVEAAVTQLREEGFDGLSMRKLAQRLGVGAMTLYGYVRTKEELLTAIAEQFLAEIEYPPANLPWKEQLKHICRAVHGVFVKHPELAEIVARQHLNAVVAFRGAEIAFAALRRAGLDGEEAMSAFLALTAFTVGFAQRERHPRRSPDFHARRLAKLGELKPDEFPNVMQVAPLFLSGATDRHFEDGLDLLVRGIASKARA